MRLQARIGHSSVLFRMHAVLDRRPGMRVSRLTHASPTNEAPRRSVVFSTMMYIRLARRIHARQRLRSQATKLGNGYDGAHVMQLTIYINLHENMLQPDKQHDNTLQQPS